MAIRKYKATTNGRRNMSVLTYEEITTDKPEKSLLVPLNKKAGRNAQGVITVRHKGGAEKRKYRIIDFKRNKDNIPAKVKSIEYDPNRSANIALVAYADGEKRYILAPQDLQVGQTIMSGANADIVVGDEGSLKNLILPVGICIPAAKVERIVFLIGELFAVQFPELRTVNHVHFIYYFLETEGGIDVYQSLSFFGFLGGDDNDTIRTAHTEDGK